MDKFPPEILHNIFILLNLKQRLICLTVCRSWWRTLQKYSLIYNTEIRQDTDRFEKMMDMFEQSPRSASQVEQLRISLDSRSRFNERTLLNIFPKARAIVEAFRVVMESIEQLTISSSTLDDELGDMLAGSFPNLVTLKLSYLFTEWVYIYVSRDPTTSGRYH